MRVLLSTIGSRGDVQPLVALALALRDAGHEPRLCTPPDFVTWIEGFGLDVMPLGPELRATARPAAAPAALPTPEQRRQMADASLANQFETLERAAQGCDVLLGATALQIAAPTVAEMRGVPYVFAAYSPNVLPSRHHAPPVYTLHGDVATDDPRQYDALWTENAARFNALFRDTLNAQRVARGLRPVDDLRSHIFTAHPWLAADPIIAPWPESGDDCVFQAGAWFMDDGQRLPPEVERFLDAGDPPVYVGFGSIRAPGNLSADTIAAARALGRRVIVSRGWADLGLVDDCDDCLLIGDVSHHALFSRVAAVVHHGGAGTTTAAARAGAPQVVIPQHYDQPYWAGRVVSLGVGARHPAGAPAIDTLRPALEHALSGPVAARARAVARKVRIDGASVAAQQLARLVG
ncbi:MAG: glycosyltransferase family 1 protein [Acidobacteria bacterium]|nr:glycosyltransferase family 1 protein [Acidobacteriota bacterium]